MITDIFGIFMQGTFHICVLLILCSKLMHLLSRERTTSLEVISNINIRSAVINVVDRPQYSFYKGQRLGMWVHVKIVK